MKHALYAQDVYGLLRYRPSLFFFGITIGEFLSNLAASRQTVWHKLHSTSRPKLASYLVQSLATSDAIFSPEASVISIPRSAAI